MESTVLANDDDEASDSRAGPASCSALIAVSSGPGVITGLIHHYAKDVGAHALQPFVGLLSVGSTVLSDAQSQQDSVHLRRHYTGVDHLHQGRRIDQHKIKLVAHRVQNPLESRGG